MKVGELFLEIGAKDKDGASRKLNGFNDSFKKLAGNATKVAKGVAVASAALFGLGAAFAKIGRTGTDLLNFSALTGLSTERLQKWQYAAKLAGVEAGEFQGSVKAVQDNIANMLSGGGAPEGFGLFANTVGLDESRIQDTFYVMEKLNEFAKSGVSKDLANNVLKSIGWSEGVIAAARRDMFREGVFAQAPMYSSKQQKQLDKVRAGFDKIKISIEKAFGGFVSRHGMTVINMLDKIVAIVINLAGWLEKVVGWLEKVVGLLGQFQIVKDITSGLSGIVDILAGKDAGKVGKDMRDKRGGRAFGEGTWWMNMLEKGAGSLSEITRVHRPEWSASMAGANNVTINQSNTFNGNVGDTATRKNIRNGTADALRQSGINKVGI